MAIDVLLTVEIIEILENYVESIRPPEKLRKEVDIGYRIDNQSVTIFELRPVWKVEGELQEIGVAKATFVKTSGTWKVFWKRASGKWEGYPPEPEVPAIRDFVRLVEADKQHCFWG